MSINYINYSDKDMATSSNNIGSVGTEDGKTSDNFNNLFNQIKSMGEQFLSQGNTDTIDNLSLMAAKDGAFDVVSYLMYKNLIKNVGAKDKDGLTLLHYLIINYSKINNPDKILDNILNNKNIGSFINAQDNINKNTPLHLATSYGLDDVVEKLIAKGADKTVLNNKNEFVGTDNENNVVTDKQNDIFLKKNTSSGLENAINNIVSLFLGSKAQPSSEASLKMTDDLKSYKINNETTVSENITPSVINKIIQNKNTNRNANDDDIDTNSIIRDVIKKNGNQMSDAKNDTSDFIQNVISNIKSQNANKTQSGGSNNGQRQMKTMSDFEINEGQMITDDSEDLVNNTDDFEKRYPNLDKYTGWAERKESRQSRSNIKYADENTDSEKPKKSMSRSSNNKEENKDLSRVIQNQSDVIHKRTVEKIMEILGVDEETAKIYKAALYDQVKSEDKDGKLNNYDRAVEMEKLATTSNLNKIDVEYWREKIAKGREERKSNLEKSNNKMKRYQEKSENSMLSVESDTSLSNTSDN
ncbi:ankyrin repeat protein [Catovirus CTV1]|uniref:Ankyrin repeat protein n=1 Tax=Catovirus CTV1 TaxID=1977631 RepID=A0A1V0SBE4_9VIRU|nr:ankyrin repeat protein [Catovirus CTV1]